ncbi:MAG TPA: hypothetical protein VL381_02920 [Rhodocyclaceae bacterium]|jgi:hypothetical protein|nr:hypothetical protein [Rhodocyclaceae bacterium]
MWVDLDGSCAQIFSSTTFAAFGGRIFAISTGAFNSTRWDGGGELKARVVSPGQSVLAFGCWHMAIQMRKG